MKRSKYILGSALGAGFFLWSVSLIQWSVFSATLRTLHANWLLGSAIALFFAVGLRSLRWHALTGLPAATRIDVWKATCLGCFHNTIYPGRIGDVTRIASLQRLTHLAPGLSITSGIADRICDGLGLCFLLLIAIVVSPAGFDAPHAVTIVALFFAATTVVATVLVTHGERLRPVFAALARRGSWGKFMAHSYEHCLMGLVLLRSPRRLTTAFSLQIAISFMDVLTCWLLIHAFGWPLPLVAGVVLLVYIAAATSLPSAPGYIGMYQFAAIFALRPYAIDASSSVAYGTVLQVLTLIIFIGLGVRFSFRATTASGTSH